MAHPQKLWRHYDISDNSYHKYCLLCGIKIININSFKLSKKRESKQDNANLTKTYPMYQI
jgi:hypothetical protein